MRSLKIQAAVLCLASCLLLSVGCSVEFSGSSPGGSYSYSSAGDNDAITDRTETEAAADLVETKELRASVTKLTGILAKGDKKVSPEKATQILAEIVKIEKRIAELDQGNIEKASHGHDHSGHDH